MKLSYNKKNFSMFFTIIFAIIIVLMSKNYLNNEKFYSIDKINSQDDSEVEEVENFEGSIKKDKRLIVVHIVGEVKNPQIIEIERGSRLYQAVEKAGGFTDEADKEKINLAQVLSDGNQYIIPNIISSKTQVGNTVSSSPLVNINYASAEELKTLDGIGDKCASRIIKYREEVGFFNSIEDLKNVHGIGESKFELIKDRIVT